jgi:hypothetical protein
MKKYLPPVVLVAITFLMTSCDKELSCENCLQTVKPLPVPQGDSALYYQFTLDNKNYQAIAYQNNFIVTGTIDWSSIADRDSGAVIGSGLVPPNTTSFPLAPFTFGLERGVIKNYSTLTLNSFQGFFATGNYAYADLKEVIPPFTPPNSNGIALLWVDESGIIWRTDNGSGNQDGSKFTIATKQSMIYPWSTTLFPTRITADFNCKIYDDSGRSKQITNGKLAYYFAKDF